MDINFVLENYIDIIVEWVMELYIIAFLMLFPLKKRSYFYARLFGGLFAVLVIGFPVTIFYTYFGNIVVGRTFVYIFLFGLAIAHLNGCFCSSKLKITVFVELAYVLQNISYKVFLLLWSSLIFVGVVPPQGVGQLAFKLIYFAQFALQVGILYFACIRIAHKKISDQKLISTAVVISMFIMVVLVFLCSMEDIYNEKLSGGIFFFPDQTTFALRQTGNLFSVVTDLCIIFLLFNAVQKNRLQSDVEYLNHLVMQSEKQYEISKDTIESINIKCHDMRHRIHDLLDGANLPQDRMEDIAQTISIYDCAVKTGNPTLDVILTEKSFTCEHNGIRFACIAEGKSVERIQHVDICCLLGNMIDNAIEATKKLSNVDRKVIHFQCKELVDGVTKIECENYYDGQLLTEEGRLITTKEKKVDHGFGIRSIENIAKKYNGTVNMHTEGQVFCLTVMLYPETK